MPIKTRLDIISIMTSLESHLIKGSRIQMIELYYKYLFPFFKDLFKISLGWQ